MDDVLIEPIKLIELHEIVFPTIEIKSDELQSNNTQSLEIPQIPQLNQVTEIIQDKKEIKVSTLSQVSTLTQLNHDKQENIPIITLTNKILDNSNINTLTIEKLNNKQIEISNYYLSFDCACATLGYILTEIEDVDINNFFIDKDIINPKSIKLKIIKQGVINLVEGFLVKDVPVRNQIYNLKVFLDSLVKDIDISIIHVIIEDQPYINDNSNQIQSGLYMYFAYAKSIVSLPATYKNTICFDKSLDIQVFYEKYSKTYSANKNHTANNLSYYYKIHNIGIDLHKSLYNHLGDAFMQFIYIIKEKVLVVNKSNTTTKSDIINKCTITKVNDINKKVKFNDKPTRVKIPIESKALTINSLINNKTITIKKRNTSDIQSNQTQQPNNIQPINQTIKETIQSQSLQNTNNKSNINKQKKSKHKKKNIDIKHLVLN
jgi:hypothetical protein